DHSAPASRGRPNASRVLSDGIQAVARVRSSCTRAIRARTFRGKISKRALHRGNVRAGLLFDVAGECQGSRVPCAHVRAPALAPRSRVLTIWLGTALLVGLDQLLPRAVHRQLTLTSALMGMLNEVLDEAASVEIGPCSRWRSFTKRPCAISQIC